MSEGPPIRFRGNWATLLLPIQDDDTIDFRLLAEELDRFAEARVNGVYSNGSAGEFHTQTETEFDRISALLAEKCAPRGILFQIGSCHMSAQISRERVRRTKSLRPAAFQIVLPDWFVPGWSEILSFLEMMAEEAAPIPLVLYNPPHAKRRLAPAEWRELAERLPALAGIKVPGGDASWYEAMAPAMQRLAVFIPGHHLAEGLARGAHGAYSNVACLSPGGAQRWYELCIRDPAEGARMGARIRTFWEANIAPLIGRDGFSNMAADKAAAAAGGWLPGFSPRLRWPYRSATPERVAAIARAGRNALPEFFPRAGGSR